MLKAVIFDFDGIIVDTEPLHYQAFQRVLEPLGLGYSWEDYVDRYMGFDDREAFSEVFVLHGMHLNGDQLEKLIYRKAHFFQDIIKNEIKPYPGVVKLVRELSEIMPLALCSGALMSDIVPILDRLDISQKFDVIVTAEDVAASKPDPASYTLAQNRLSSKYPALMITPDTCLAIEDTPAGIVSAKTAGIAVLAVTNSYMREKLVGASFIVDSLEMITLRNLQEMFS